MSASTVLTAYSAPAYSLLRGFVRSEVAERSWTAILKDDMRSNADLYIAISDADLALLRGLKIRGHGDDELFPVYRGK